MMRTLILEDTDGTDIIILEWVSQINIDRLFEVEVFKLLLYHSYFSFSKKHYVVLDAKICTIEHKKRDIKLKDDLQWMMKSSTK